MSFFEFLDVVSVLVGDFNQPLLASDGGVQFVLELVDLCPVVETHEGSYHEFSQR